MSASPDRFEPEQPRAHHDKPRPKGKPPSGALPPRAKPPVPPGHVTVAASFEQMMSAAYGKNWKWTLPNDQKQALRDTFFSGFVAFIGAVAEGIETITDHIPQAFAFLLIHWQDEIEEYAKANLSRMARKPK